MRQQRGVSAAVSQMEEVRKKYYGTDKWLKAPNGKDTNLTERQWLQVRTPNFKEWFGDWEKKIRIDKLLNSEMLVLKWDAESPAYDLNVSSAESFIHREYQGKVFENDDTEEKYVLSKKGRQKLLSHGRYNKVHLKSLFFLPQIIKHSTFITEIDSYKENGKYERYQYFVCGINLDGTDYTVKSVFGLDSNGVWVYDQGLSQIEKGTLIGMRTKHVTQDSLQVKDTTLLSILQDDYSKVLDENGEPLVVLHGSQIEWNAFNMNEARQNSDIVGAYFSSAREEAETYGYGGYIREFYLNIQTPAPYDYAYDVFTDNRTKMDSGAIAREALLTEGYDEVILREEGENDEYIVFNPNQLKSATDNNGDFSIGDDDIRYQQSASPLNQTIQGHTEPALIKSSFRFDKDTGKYYISGGVYKKIVEVMRSSFHIINDTVETEVRKTATLATAFLISLSEDTQDSLVRKSATATGGKFLTGGNENLLRLFFNMNELKDTKDVNEYTKGLSLSQSAKVILGVNSDESTIRHEGTHIIWWADSEFRERAQTEFKKYFEQDSDGKEIRAVVEANLDRFGGYTADQVINAWKIPQEMTTIPFN